MYIISYISHAKHYIHFQVVRLIILLWLVAAILSTGPFFGWNAYVAEVTISYLICISYITHYVSDGSFIVYYTSGMSVLPRS